MKFINNLRNLLSLDRMQQQRQLRLCERMIDEAENCSSFKELLAISIYSAKGFIYPIWITSLQACSVQLPPS